jgi:two-component system, cell cycle sensor histidine kinase and response regulator CckA
MSEKPTYEELEQRVRELEQAESERKEVEDTLRESESRLREAQRLAHMGNWFWDVNSGKVEWSNEVFKIFRLDPKEFTPQIDSIQALSPWPEDHQRDKELIQKAVESREVGSYEQRFLRPDGSTGYYFSSFQGIYNDNGKLTAINGVVQDITDRKRTEEALQESEEFLRTIVENIPDMIFIKDAKELRFVRFNKAGEELLGYSREDLIGKNDHDFFPKEEADFFTEKDRTVLSSGEPLDISEESIQTRYKGERILHTKKLSILNEEGKPRYLLGISEDITERKQAEETLRESENKYRIIAENMADIITTMDMNLRFTYVSPSIIQLRGFTVEEALEQTIDQIMTPDSFQLIANAFEEELLLEATATADPDRTRILELEEYKKDGSTIWVENTSSFIRDQDQKPIGILVVSRDISERRRAESELKELSSHQKSLLSAIPDIVVKVDHHKVYTWTNQPGYNFFGDDVIGKEASHYFEAEQNTYEVVQPIFNGEEDVIYLESWQRRKDGEKRLLAWWCKVLKGETGKVMGALSTARDITDQAKMQEQLRQAQKMESIGNLAGGIAHDFNNMLSIISGNTEMILEDVDPKNSIVSNLHEIRKAAQRSADLTRQLLAFARKQTIAPKVLNLNETIDGMLSMLCRLIGEDIDLAWLPQDDLWPTQVDPSQVDQVLANLCVNARDSIQGVGKVTIETANSKFDEDYCREHEGFKPGDFVMMAVSDSGIGMDKETLEKIFEPFFSTKDIGKGTGLGLATVYGIVKQNNGFVNVYSEPDQGTTFKIYLPRHMAKPAHLPEKVSGQPAERGHEMILLVEDEVAILRMTTMMLERLGYTVASASTPGEAIRLANECAGEINLLMTDVVMPEMNGRDLAKNILAFHPNLKRLFMSGYTANVIAHHGVLDEGVNFIQKPFSRENLSAKVREVLDADKD